ncbi:hypothetical protein [Endozoicomonas sp. SESOKO3]|uniref:hypothetical protein n=1 Tax=Endozoicomonas sp. SESOKO3 TaxID=2828744 RepID=UPI0021482CEE|nr:hypothetical protein [Endozoicomonas sp. SESOKO3]
MHALSSAQVTTDEHYGIFTEINSSVLLPISATFVLRKVLSAILGDTLTRTSPHE